MKIKDCFVLQQIHDEYLVVPIGEEMDRLNGVIKLSETGAFLWELLSKGVGSEDDLISAVMAEYGQFTPGAVSCKGKICKMEMCSCAKKRNHCVKEPKSPTPQSLSLRMAETGSKTPLRRLLRI